MPAMTSGGLPQQPMGQPRPMPNWEMRPAMTSGGLPQQPMRTPMPSSGGGWSRPGYNPQHNVQPGNIGGQGASGFRPQGVRGLFDGMHFGGAK